MENVAWRGGCRVSGVGFGVSSLIPTRDTRHAPQSVFPIVNQGELAVLYCFLFLYLAFAGGGPWSLDRLVSRRAVAK